MINKTCDRVLTNERVSDLVRMIKECEPKQSIMHLTFGYGFLKQAGSFFYLLFAWPEDVRLTAL